MKTLREKLEDIIQLNNKATNYMKDMLSHLTLGNYQDHNKRILISVNELENSVEYWYGYENHYIYTLEHCIGELVLNKGKNILQQIDWLD